MNVANPVQSNLFDFFVQKNLRKSNLPADFNAVLKNLNITSDNIENLRAVVTPLKIEIREDFTKKDLQGYYDFLSNVKFYIKSKLLNESDNSTKFNLKASPALEAYEYRGHNFIGVTESSNSYAMLFE